MQISRDSWAAALGLLWLCAGQGSAQADPPPAAPESVPGESASAPSQVSESKGGYATSLKQAFEEDPSREVVRGHFDQGSPPHTHRYYCLVDPKTAKTEPNGVAGQLTKRRDGMTGIKEPAVSPLSCADAQQKGLLVTTGYLVKGPVGSSTGSSPGSTATAQGTTADVSRAGGKVSSPTGELSSPAGNAGSSAGVPSGAPGSVGGGSAGGATASLGNPGGPPASMTAPVPRPPEPAAAGPVNSSVQTEILAVYARFIFGQNAHDRAAVAEVLLDSKDFVLAEYGGNSVWGYQEALDYFEQQWRGTWRLDPQLKELHVASPATGVAVLITPLLYTSGAAGHAGSTVPVRWGGMFVRTNSGWRISAIFIAPLRDWRGPNGK